jgi:hypothetical protein
MPPFCGIQRIRLDAFSGAERMAQARKIQIRQLQIEYHHVRIGCQLCESRSRAGHRNRGVLAATEQACQLLPASWISVRNQYVQRGHGVKVQGSRALGHASAGTPKKRNGRLVVARRPSPALTTQGRGITAAVLLSPATGWLIRRSGGQGEALASIPRPDGHPTWFVYGSAASRIGSRTDRSHCTPRR